MRFLCEQLQPRRDANSRETALSALPPHEIAQEIFEGQDPRRCFQNKKPPDFFNWHEQKRLYLLSSTTNSIAVAAISLAHLEEWIHEGCPFLCQFSYANFTKWIFSRCSCCCWSRHPSGQESTGQRRVEVELHCWCLRERGTKRPHTDGTFLSTCL